MYIGFFVGLSIFIIGLIVGIFYFIKGAITRDENDESTKGLIWIVVMNVGNLILQIFYIIIKHSVN